MGEEKGRSLWNMLSFSLKLVSKIDSLRRYFLVNGLGLLIVLLELVGLISVLPIVLFAIDPDQDRNFVMTFKQEFLPHLEYLDFLYLTGGSIILFLIFKTIVSIWLYKIQINYFFKISFKLSQQMLLNYIEKGFSYMNKKDHMNLWRDVSVNPYTFGVSFLRSLSSLFSEVIVLGTILTGILIYNYRILLLIAIVVGPVVTLFNLMTRKKLNYLGEKKNEIYPMSNLELLEFLDGFPEVFLNGKAINFKEAYCLKRKNLDRIDIKTELIHYLPNRILEISIISSVFVVIVYSIYTNKSSSVIVTTLTVFCAAAYRIMPSISKIMGALIKLRSNEFLFKIFEEIDFSVKTKDLALNLDKNIEKKDLKKNVEIQEVSFSYNESAPMILQNLNFMIEKNKIVGIIGESGSGKSTLGFLLLRLLKENEGNYKVDGKKLINNEVKNWQNNMAYVPQNVLLIKGSLLDNIVLEKNRDFDVPEMKINEIIINCRLHQLAKTKEEAKEFMIKYRGQNLSGGQKQRIGIARALYREADLILFDEPTSSLDPATEQEILSLIKGLKELGKTIIIITHKMENLSICDEIYRVSGGKIKAESQNNMFRCLNS